MSDPYRWLEDDNSQETIEWIKAQNKVTFDYLGQIPEREDIKKRLRQIWNYEKLTTPIKDAGKYYYWKNDGLQNQPVLFCKQSWDSQEKVVLNPNLLSQDGTVSVTKISFSKDGKYLAYCLSDGGSDWQTIKVLDLSSGQTLSDTVRWVKFSQIAWYKDGFFYSGYDAPDDDKVLVEKNQWHKLFYHRLGQVQSQDKLIYKDSKQECNVGAVTSQDECFLILSTAISTSGNTIKIADLSKTNSDNLQINFVDVVSEFEHDFHFVESDDCKLYFLTNFQAPNNQVLALDYKSDKISDWQNIIEEKSSKLDSVILVGGCFVCHYLKDARSQLELVDIGTGQNTLIDLQIVGSIGNLSGKKGDNEFFYSLASFVSPTQIYSCELQQGRASLIQSPKLNFKPEDYETRQVFYTSQDGTTVPMFISGKKGFELNGLNPTILYGYGGFNVSVIPSFSPSMLAFMERGGLFCVPNIRGGGEYGKKWHEQGIKTKKQNVFYDFISAAEYLIEKKYTTSSKLAIEGGSNGGLLVGACLTQRPDLFAVCLPAVGVLDMLRYHKFTIGWAWAYDYGTSEESKQMFEYLLTYSPLHNCNKANYPAVLIRTADHDDRVVPAHSFKFAAALQDAQQSDNPVLIRIDTRAGHGAGKATSQFIEERSDILAFTLQNMGEFTS